MNAALMLAGVLAADFTLFMQGLMAATGPDVVTAPMRLYKYLETEKHLPRWHRELMETKGIITVHRTENGVQRRIEFPLLDTQLLAGDRVELRASDQSYQGELRRLAAEANDYVYVARPKEGDKYLWNSKKILEMKKKTVELTKLGLDTPPLDTLEEFVEGLKNHAHVVGPVRNVIVVSHAHWSGMLMLYGEEVAFPYESLMEAGASRSLKIPDEVFQPRNGNGQQLLIFKGCEFGTATPFLRKLHEILNPQARLYAPKFIFGVGTDDTNGLFEFMAQRFFIRTPKQLTRDEIRQGFINMKLKELPDGPGGSPRSIPESRWNTYLPTDAAKYKLEKGSKFEFSMPDPNAQVPDIQWDGHQIPKHPFPGNVVILKGIKIRFPKAGDIDLPTPVTDGAFKQDKVKALKDTLAALPPNPANAYSKAHPFPWWVRFRFTPADDSDAALKKAQSDWVDTLKWDLKFELEGGRNYLKGSGTGYIYHLTLPILDASGQLLVNYYATDAPNNPVREDLSLDKTKFWASIG